MARRAARPRGSGAQALETPPILEELDDLHELGLRLVDARNIRPDDLQADSFSIVAGLTRGMNRSVMTSSTTMIPKNTSGAQVRIRSWMCCESISHSP